MNLRPFLGFFNPWVDRIIVKDPEFGEASYFWLESRLANSFLFWYREVMAAIESLANFLTWTEFLFGVINWKPDLDRIGAEVFLYEIELLFLVCWFLLGLGLGLISESIIRVDGCKI